MGTAELRSQVLFDFVTDVARSPSVERLQANYLDGIGEFVGAFAAGLYVLDPFTQGAETYAARGVSDLFLSRYEAFGRRHDPVLERALATRAPVDNHMLMGADRWRALPVYGEVFELHRMTALLEAPLVSDGEVIGTLNFGRTDAEGPFTARDRRLAGAIARLVGIALQAVRQRDRLARERDSVVAALELAGDAIVVTDLRANARRTNAAARSLLARLADPEGALEQLMARRGRDATRHDVEALLADGRRGRLRGRTVPGESDPLVTISFLELVPEHEGASLRPALAGALTRREREVAALAVSGLRDAEIAERLQLSPYTVKQYLRATYGKLGVRSRVELASLALGR